MTDMLRAFEAAVHSHGLRVIRPRITLPITIGFFSAFSRSLALETTLNIAVTFCHTAT